MILRRRFTLLHGLKFLRDLSESNEGIIRQDINLESDAKINMETSEYLISDHAAES